MQLFRLLQYLFAIAKTHNLDNGIQVVNYHWYAEKIKNKIPGAGAALESIFKIIHGEQSSKKELSEMSREELQKEMEEAVNSNNFEKAATIRDILKNK